MESTKWHWELGCGMSVKWSRYLDCYVWDCMFGCRGEDYTDEQEAIDAFVEHPCYADEAS